MVLHKYNESGHPVVPRTTILKQSTLTHKSGTDIIHLNASTESISYNWQTPWSFVAQVAISVRVNIVALTPTCVSHGHAGRIERAFASTPLFLLTAAGSSSRLEQTPMDFTNNFLCRS